MLEKFKAAFNTELGIVFIILIAGLGILGSIYLYLLLKHRKLDRLRYEYNSYYEAAEALAKNYKFKNYPTIEFFGRESIVQLKDGTYQICLIPPPQFAKPDVCERFELFQKHIEINPNKIFASYPWTHTSNPLILMQNNLLQKDGRKLLPINKFLKDSSLSLTDRENILLELAKALSSLHAKNSSLYHGFLIPRSVFIDRDESKQLKRIVIANLGLMFSFGPIMIHQLLTKLNKGIYKIDRWSTQEILDQVTMLAPEQLNPERFDEVGSASDFYTFGALATFIFTGAKFQSFEKICWQGVPEKWRPFLKQCLQDSTVQRPKHFDELEEWLTDPELGLTHHSFEIVKQTNHYKNAEEVFNIEKFQVFTHDELKEITELNQFTKNFHLGCEAIKEGNWIYANKVLLKAAKLNHQHLETLIHLAISYYELGELNKAENYYRIVKEKNPEIAKTFRDHIAFRV